MKKYFLTSVFVIGCVSPVFGADVIITDDTNTCNSDILGVSDDGEMVQTIAVWRLKNYTCLSGEYLFVDGDIIECRPCPSGSYCPKSGNEFTIEDTGNIQCPSEYPLSDEGAVLDSYCYHKCTVDMVANATDVIGNVYNNVGVNTCEPTGCVLGWHLKPGFNLKNTIGEDSGISDAITDNNGSFREIDGDNGLEYYGISDKNSFAVDYAGKGMLKGHARCSTQQGSNNSYTWTNPTVVNGLEDETGQEGARYCYCQVDGFTPVGGDTIALKSSSWVFNFDDGTAYACAVECSYSCAYYLYRKTESALGFRAALFGAAPVLNPTCEPNTITIDWDPNNNTAHIQNQCLYDGAIKLPDAPVKLGYKFIGWKLVE